MSTISSFAASSLDIILLETAILGHEAGGTARGPTSTTEARATATTFTASDHTQMQLRVNVLLKWERAIKLEKVTNPCGVLMHDHDSSSLTTCASFRCVIG